MESSLGKRFMYETDVFFIAGFNVDAKDAGRNGTAFAGFFVGNGNNVRSKAGKQSGDFCKLAWPVFKLDRQRIAAAGFEQTAFDDFGKDRNVDIASRKQADDVFAFDRDLVEHDSRN